MRVNGSRIVKPANCSVRCTCIVDLLSRAQRPYQFRVTVTGEPPHAAIEVYDIPARSDTEAAFAAMARFTRKMEAKTHPLLAILT